MSPVQSVTHVTGSDPPTLPHKGGGGSYLFPSPLMGEGRVGGVYQMKRATAAMGS